MTNWTENIINNMTNYSWFSETPTKIDTPAMYESILNQLGSQMKIVILMVSISVMMRLLFEAIPEKYSDRLKIGDIRIIKILAVIAEGISILSAAWLLDMIIGF